MPRVDRMSTRSRLRNSGRPSAQAGTASAAPAVAAIASASSKSGAAAATGRAAAAPPPPLVEGISSPAAARVAFTVAALPGAPFFLVFLGRNARAAAGADAAERFVVMMGERQVRPWDFNAGHGSKQVASARSSVRFVTGRRVEGVRFAFTRMQAELCSSLSFFFISRRAPGSAHRRLDPPVRGPPLGSSHAHLAHTRPVRAGRRRSHHQTQLRPAAPRPSLLACCPGSTPRGASPAGCQQGAREGEVWECVCVCVCVCVWLDA